MPLPTTSHDWETQLAEIGLTDLRRGAEHLADAAGEGEAAEHFAHVLPALLRLLAESANPDQAVVQFARFAQGVPDRAELFRFLNSTPRATEILLRLFVSSQFLAEILIANPDYLARLTQHQKLAELKCREEFYLEALASTAGSLDEAIQLDALRRYQRWELLRIGACDAFGIVDLRAVTIQLSLLADGLVQACLELAAQRSQQTTEGLVILALGKLGGEELNYSSDIDLIFLAESDPQNYWQVCQRLIQGLNRQTGAGFLYRVDMRLRPWGKSGPLVSSLESYSDYLRNNAALWELQALLKARVIAGDFAVGKKFLAALPPFLFHTPPDVLQKNVRETKESIEAGVIGHGSTWGNVKSGVGSIRDVEFVAQYLQLRHGGTRPEIRTFNTLEALVRLAESDLLQADEYRILTDGYVFLRKVEHALQLLHYKQSHQLPTEPEELEYLARRLDFPTINSFLGHFEQHCVHIREVYQRYLHPLPVVPEPQSRKVSAVERHLARMVHSYSQAFSPLEIVHHSELAQLISDENLIVLEPISLGPDEWKITIIAYDYHGELSLICGLLFEYGFDILSGQVFTYHGSDSPADEARPKIVDVFRVRRSTVETNGHVPTTAATHNDDTVWQQYRDELHGYLRRLHRGEWQLTQGDLAKRVAASIEHTSTSEAPLYPIELNFDNTLSDRYTVFTIRGRDTAGFLYELTHALALNGVSIGCVELQTVQGIANDTLYVTDEAGKKITDPDALQKLRTTTVLIKHFTHLLPHSPNPVTALLHFREFLAQLTTRPDWPSEIASLEQSDVLDALARLLGVSDFLWNDFLRMQYANLFPVVRDVAQHSRRITQTELAEQLAQQLWDYKGHAQRVAVLEAFRDREMFRVDMRHILGQIKEFGDFSNELTDVAEVVVRGSLQLCLEELQGRFGVPQLARDEEDLAPNSAPDELPRPCPISLCALGKCGGRELGFASDIELMLLFAGPGETTGPEKISNKEYCLKLVEKLSLILRTRREGIFEVDWRLRPYGRAGDLPVSLATFETYFQHGGPAWPFERQALVKLRPIAGDQGFGQRIVAARDALLYHGEAFDLRAMRGMRERQVQQLVTAGTVNAKFSPGGLVDVEYYIQGLQITYGKLLPSLRATNTWMALAALEATAVLP
ncbi:MAG: (Glutamate--ammonia-ligase) adenylyltransferase, partial [Planctomycetaceae bacterium]|nr:(Glutamate--ammonia-ligase) adenylyltransferase [Planctomycetaceae bacterium]